MAICSWMGRKGQLCVGKGGRKQGKVIPSIDWAFCDQMEDGIKEGKEGMVCYIKSALSLIHLFSLLRAGFTNLLALNPFSRSAPNPLSFTLPTVSTVYVLPMIMLSLPILKSRQLSLARSFTCFLFSLAVVRMGDSPRDSTLSIDSSISSSLSLTQSEKQPCFNASSAVILSTGFTSNIFLSRSITLGSAWSYSGALRLKLQSRFSVRTSLQVLPLKMLLPKCRMWKMRPRLKISHTGWYFAFMSFRLITSGATYPGVPHRMKRYSSESANSASPQSAITQSLEFLDLKRMFYGLRSLCMMFLECISLNPYSRSWMIFLTWFGLNFCLFCIRWMVP